MILHPSVALAEFHQARKMGFHSGFDLTCRDVGKLTLASAGDEPGSIRQYEHEKFLFRTAGGELDPSGLLRQTQTVQDGTG